MKKLFLLAILFLLALSGCVLPNNNSTVVKQNKNSIATTTTTTTTTAISTIIPIAITTVATNTLPTIATCANLEPGYAQDKCYEAVAKVTKDLSLCHKVQTQEVFFCYLYVAEANDDYSICDLPEIKLSTPSSKNQCLFEVALHKNDFSMCAKLALPEKYYCYRSFAIKLNDLTICDNIKETGTIYGNLIYQEQKDLCFKSIIIARNNESLCYLLTNALDQDNCYQEIAIAKEDQSICDKIKTATWTCKFISTRPDGSGGGTEECEVSKETCYQAVEQSK